MRKSQLLTVRMDDDKYWEFQAACKALGIPMSALVTQYVFKVVRETKRDMPHEFETELATLLANKPASNQHAPNTALSTTNQIIKARRIMPTKKGGRK